MRRWRRSNINSGLPLQQVTATEILLWVLKHRWAFHTVHSISPVSSSCGETNPEQDEYAESKSLELYSTIRFPGSYTNHVRFSLTTRCPDQFTLDSRVSLISIRSSHDKYGEDIKGWLNFINSRVSKSPFEIKAPLQAVEVRHIGWATLPRLNTLVEVKGSAKVLRYTHGTLNPPGPIKEILAWVRYISRRVTCADGIGICFYHIIRVRM